MMLCAVVIGNNWNDSVIQTEHRHKNKTVQFKVNSVDGNRSSTESSKNNIYKIRNYRGD